MDGVFGVVACCDGAPEGFDSSDGGFGGAGNDNIDWNSECCGAAGEEFDAILDTVDGAGGGEFAKRDGFGWVNAALGDPVGDAREIYGAHIDSMTRCGQLVD